VSKEKNEKKKGVRGMSAAAESDVEKGGRTTTKYEKAVCRAGWLIVWGCCFSSFFFFYSYLVPTFGGVC
jgi:hypothetical protein